MFCVFVNVGFLLSTDVKLYAKFCFIEYDSEAAAEVAVAAENGTLFKDVKLGITDQCCPIRNFCDITILCGAWWLIGSSSPFVQRVMGSNPTLAAT